MYLLFLFPITGLCSGHSPVLTETSDSVKNALPDDVPSKWHFNIHPSLGMTLGTTNYESVKTTDLQWLGTLNSDIDYMGKKWDFSTSLFAQYGQSKKSGEPAEKIKDAFILSLTPSIPVIKKPAVRLFLETTAETTLGKGTLQNNPTGFCDPLFLYQALFLGQKHYSYQKNDRIQYDLTYGLGYAFQQTFNNKFQVQDSITGQRQGFESGFSGLIDFKMDYAISKEVSFNISTKVLALSRESIFSNFDSARKSVLLSSGIFFRKIGLEYNYHFVHDLNLSAYSMIDQSLMLTLRL
jgi:outer membrane protein W